MKPSNQTMAPLGNTEHDDGSSWLSIPLSLLGLFFSVTIVLIAIQYYFKKGLRRDIVNLEEKKNKLDKVASKALAKVKFTRLETQLSSMETASVKAGGKPTEKSGQNVKEQEKQQAAPPPPPAEEKPKSILKASPVEQKASGYFFPTDFLETILLANSTLVYPPKAGSEQPKELEELPLEPLEMAQYKEYMRAFVHPSKERSKLAKAIAFAEMLVASLGISVAHWENSSPLADLEMIGLNWFGRMFSLPNEFLFPIEAMETGQGGGCFTDNQDESLLLAVLATRTAKINEAVGTKEQHFLQGQAKMDEIHAECEKVVVYGKEKEIGHLHVETVCAMAGVVWHPLGEVTKEKLEAAINNDVLEGKQPALVILIHHKDILSQQLEEITKLAKTHNMLIHLDCGPSAARAWLTSPYQPSFLSMDTISISLSNTTVLFVKDQRSYCCLYAKGDPAKPGRAFNPTEFSIHERRRLKGLRMWFIFQLLGVNQLKKELLPKAMKAVAVAKKP